MKLATVLSGQAFIFRSLKEVLAKANELKSGDVLAGVAASSDLERIAAKEVLSQLLLSDLRNHPVVPYEEDEVTRINQDGIDETVYQRIKNWTVAELSFGERPLTSYPGLRPSLHRNGYLQISPSIQIFPHYFCHTATFTGYFRYRRISPPSKQSALLALPLSYQLPH